MRPGHHLPHRPFLSSPFRATERTEYLRPWSVLFRLVGDSIGCCILAGNTFPAHIRSKIKCAGVDDELSSLFERTRLYNKSTASTKLISNQIDHVASIGSVFLFSHPPTPRQQSPCKQIPLPPSLPPFPRSLRMWTPPMLGTG